MQQLGFQQAVDLETIAEKDRDSARIREAAIKDHTPTWLAFIVTVGFFAALGAMILMPVPEASRDVLNIMLGSLGSAWIAIIAYYFGASAGGDKLINRFKAN